MTRKVKSNTYENGDLSAIGGNWVTFAYRDMVNYTGGAVIKAVAGGVISGVAKQNATFSSDNQTVAKATLTYEPVKDSNTYRMTITGGTITIADEGKYYDLATATTVDWATESTTTWQLELVKFVTATSSDFKIVNK